MTTSKAINKICAELESAKAKYPDFHSNHEGYAVIKEELDELWDEIKKSKSVRGNERMRHEAIQVATMAVRFLTDLID